jgi:hypothetical protein
MLPIQDLGHQRDNRTLAKVFFSHRSSLIYSKKSVRIRAIRGKEFDGAFTQLTYARGLQCIPGKVLHAHAWEIYGSQRPCNGAQHEFPKQYNDGVRRVSCDVRSSNSPFGIWLLYKMHLF